MIKPGLRHRRRLLFDRVIDTRWKEGYNTYPSGAHSFSDGCDGVCDVCGASRNVEHAYVGTVITEATCTTDGVVVLLTFRVKEGAAVGTTDITLSYNPEDVYDTEFNNVGFRVENGIVTVVEYVPGDVNRDGKVNNKDLGLLQQVINEWDVNYDSNAADTNGDSRINNKDLGLLQRYLNAWDVTLG